VYVCQMFVVKGCIADLPINFETLVYVLVWQIFMFKLCSAKLLSRPLVLRCSHFCRWTAACTPCHRTDLLGTKRQPAFITFINKNDTITKRNMFPYVVFIWVFNQIGQNTISTSSNILLLELLLLLTEWQIELMYIMPNFKTNTVVAN